MSQSLRPARLLIDQNRFIGQGASRSSLSTSGVVYCFGSCVIGGLLHSEPGFQFWWCWFASVFLLLASVRGKIFRLPNDYAIVEQSLRPWFLINFIFCTYNFITSVFYWLNLHGWFFFSLDPYKTLDIYDIELTAFCQFMFLVGHASFLMGMGTFINRQGPHVSSYVVDYRRSMTMILLWLAALGLSVKLFFVLIPGFNQFAVRGQAISTISAAISLGIAYRTRSPLLVASLVANAIMLMLAVASGWKEEVLVHVVLLSAAFYPVFPRVTILGTGAILGIGFFLLPSFSSVVREESWNGNRSSLEALEIAADKIGSKPMSELLVGSWEFLTYRISEVGMTTRYVSSVPAKRPFYEFEILQQAIVTPFPRILWPTKQLTEEVVHQRVIENGVVAKESIVSAKPTYITDGYLSFGILGVSISMFLYGAAVQWFSIFCERYLGGILIGGVLFNGLFAIMWRSTCWEFMMNTCFWSLFFIFILHHLFRGIGFVTKEIPPAIVVRADS